MHTVVAPPGLVVVDTKFNVLACNPDAVQILTFPERQETVKDLNGWLAGRVRAHLVDRRSHGTPGFVTEFRSARRVYICRAFPLSFAFPGPLSSQSGTIVLMERKSNGVPSIADLSQRFGLTTREQQTVQLLLQGLTSKEIAQRMGISPNTVKAFIRLVMVKMGVSTRSGIVGRIIDGREPGKETTIQS